MTEDKHIAGKRRALEAALPRLLAFGQLSPRDKWEAKFAEQDPDVKAYWRNQAEEVLG